MLKFPLQEKNITPDINKIISHSLAKNTQIAYEKGWDRFKNYCFLRKLVALPSTPEIVAQYIAWMGNNVSLLSGKPFSVGTIIVNVSAINKVHELSGHTSPTNDPKVRLIISGIKRMKGTAPKQVLALREFHIKKMLKYCSENPIGLRNAALIALGFSAALRRSEIVSLCVEDIDFPSQEKNQGLYLHIRKSKTDQHGSGQVVPVLQGKQIKPIHRLKKWLNVSGISSGYVFRTMSKGGKLRNNPMHHSDIPRILKCYASLIGLPSEKIAGHSLRAGFVTSAIANRARIDKIMEITRHKSTTTLVNYMRDSEAFDDHAGASFL